MFGSTIVALSAAQHKAVDALVADATEAGNTVDGMLFSNNIEYGNDDTRVVLVIEDSPATGSEYDRTYSFEGEELARGNASALFFFEQALTAQTLTALATEGTAELVA